jgi:hypothetical protein
MLLKIILRRVQSRREDPKTLERCRQASTGANPVWVDVHLMWLQMSASLQSGQDR